MDTDPREGNTKFCGRYFGVGTNKAAADVVSRCSKKYLILKIIWQQILQIFHWNLVIQIKEKF